MFKLKRSLADKYFSEYIRKRAGWSCERCRVEYEPPTTALHCSHFYGRGNKSTRFDPDNASALCYGCHQRMGAHPNEHVEFFKKRLGEKRFEALANRFHIPQKVDEKLIVLWCKQEIKKLKEKEPVIFGEH